LETDLTKKRDLLEKQRLEIAAAIKQAERIGYPDVIMYRHAGLGRCLVSLATTEANSEEKRKLLESADEHIKEEMKLRGQLERFNYWNLGSSWINLAYLRAELSQIETDAEKKKNMLEEAVSYHERGLQLCIKHNSHEMKKGDLSLVGNLGFKYYEYGERLGLLYGLTHNDEFQRKALKAFKDSAELFQKVNIVSRVAESCWKAARSYDALGEHLKAAENFNLASDNYKRAAEKIPQLKDFYQDHASYMEAWNAIEKARHHHAEKQYGQAKEHYEKAANLHKSTTRWNYLSPNYLAWAKLEEGEDLSRREQTEEAKDLFQQAAKLFAEAKKSIQAKLEKIEDKDEKELLVNLAEASDVREEYCLGRIALEEAKILDKQGDHAASSRKYGSATEKFQKAADAMTDESDRQELKPIVYLCQAWQTMTRAEAEASPDLYKEASKLFEEAKDHSLDEKAKMLALGHSRFCKALEAGTRYEDSRDTSLHTLATQHLESAASYYLKAGFKSASEYAEATQKLLDAYLYMHKAKTATDPAEKAQFYMMTEKMLQASAGSYLKAKHPEKQEQVSSLLEKVKNERELAISLTEVLHVPLATSTTATFTTPTPTEETPTGLERFDNADIQANLIIRQKELKVGEPLNLEIELVNAGKGPAVLIKVNEVIPEGFDLTEKPETCRVEDGYIDMKGKRLGPLKTEELRLVLKPKVQGAFVLKPTVLYLDENGKYKSHEPESVTIIVRELGIKGWLKGER
jgi:tetratricopeptide (TPR) repeat protein